MLSGLAKTYDPRHHMRLQREQIEFGGCSKYILVETKKLSTICMENNIEKVNYLSIDVEGAEFEVIKSIDFDKVFIDVIEFENNYNDSNTHQIVEYLANKGYMIIPHQTLDIFMIHRNSEFFKNI